jgi:hypothetical protein
MDRQAQPYARLGHVVGHGPFLQPPDQQPFHLRAPPLVHSHRGLDHPVGAAADLLCGDCFTQGHVEKAHPRLLAGQAAHLDQGFPLDGIEWTDRPANRQ